MSIVKRKPIHVYIPFERVEKTEDGCIVEGYAFVNEVVRGEGGIAIKRSAMEAATPDYMRFANVREMHGRNAAGVVQEHQWDDRGCFLRTKVVDPVAAVKCEEGVYKGYSIGIQPLVMRGKDVEKLDWIETSLVDRPKDPDAVFTAYRADELSEEGADCEVADEAPAAEDRVDEPATEAAAEPPAEPETPRIAPEELEALEAQRAAAVAALTPPVDEAEAPVADESVERADSDKAKENGHDSPPKGYPEDKSKYADPKNFKYPVDTAEHAKAAWSYINKAKNAGEYSAEELAKIKARIRAACKKFGIEISEERAAEAEEGSTEHEARSTKQDNDPSPSRFVPSAASRASRSGLPEERAQTAATVPVRENLEGKKVCRACKGSGYVPDGDEERVDATAEADPVAETPESETISRIAALEADKTALITRAETAEAEIARVAGELETRSGELAQARERITVLERMPATQNRPVLFPQALERDFFINRANDRSADLTAVREKLAALQAQRPTDPGEQNALAQQVNLLKQQIAALA
jgi:hypothetical protein